MSATANHGDLPLLELMAFEAASRLGSFLRAADELHVTQSAVSHRVGNLERRLGVALFLRKGRGIELTEAGGEYLEGVRGALVSLWQSGERLRGDEHQVLRLAAAPSIGVVWMLPQLHRFVDGHPGLRLEVSTVAFPEDAAQSGWDLLVHYGAGSGEGGRRQPLFTDHLQVVCAPGLAEGFGGRLALDDLRRLPLLRHSLLDWAPWTAGAFGERLDAPCAMFVDDAVTMLEAAAAGAGLALTTRMAARPYLEAGRLVLAHPHAHPDKEYYAELSEAGVLKPAAQAMLVWLERLAAH